MKNLLKTLIVFCACACGLTTVSTLAFADCKTMYNDEWNDLSTTMAELYDKGDYDAALNYGKRLNIICPRSPIVNYTMSEIYRKMGNEKEAASYAKRATDYITDYPVPQALAERIWLKHAEYELPYKAEAESLKAQMADYEELKANYESLVATTKEANIRSEYESRDSAIKNAQVLEKSLSGWKAMLWTGVGVTAAGAALAITGGVMTNKVDKVEYSRPDNASVNSGFKVTQGYVTSFALLGAGVSLAVIGATLTGVAGYEVAHIDINGDGEKDESVSFNVAPSAVQFGMTF